MIGFASEDQIQRATVDFLQIAAPADLVWYHCPNGETRSPKTGAKLKQMGVLPGVADLCFVLPGGHAAFIELKNAKGSKSPSQRKFMERVKAVDGLYALCRSSQQVQAKLEEWGVKFSVRIAA